MQLHFLIFRQVLISHLDVDKEKEFYGLVKKKLMDPPWNFDADNSSNWEVGMYILFSIITYPFDWVPLHIHIVSENESGVRLSFCTGPVPRNSLPEYI